MARDVRRMMKRAGELSGEWGRRLGLLRYRPEQRSSDEWTSAYRAGTLEYYGQLDELARYSVIVGYLRWFAEGPPLRAPRVLDAGSGSGLLRGRLEGIPFGGYVGADLSEVAIAEARDRDYARSEFVVGDVATLDLGRFDVVVLNEVLYYASDTRAFLGRIASLLEPGGIVVISMWRHPRDRDIWKIVGEELAVIDRVEVRNRANAMNARGWIVACCTARR